MLLSIQVSRSCPKPVLIHPVSPNTKAIVRMIILLCAKMLRGKCVYNHINQ